MDAEDLAAGDHHHRLGPTTFVSKTIPIKLKINQKLTDRTRKRRNIAESNTKSLRFRMSYSVFLRIHDAVVEHDSYFAKKRNCARKLGLSSLQKITGVLRMLAYGIPADSVDEYVRIRASTTIKSLNFFVKAVNEVFSEEYLRSPNAANIARLLAVNESHRFLGMVGSLDCMHWKWKNCPAAWKGMYTSHVREPTLILEAVASYDLWIWHVFFGVPGANNDINVPRRSPLFPELS
ncbi:uncharacterized protein LOC131299636 [Rhododendron vialii]|uniref:uncharacterized protein LOC131299636 n=1 Tax=Rhododendron vialii TaxID=182163 RepID=UPI00265F0AEA|nr:uncharacterized protein LOC131299636 [Rhododendron vialii]